MSRHDDAVSEIARQPWRTPTLVNLSARRTESGQPSTVEGILIVSSTYRILIGPVTTDNGS